MAATAPSEVARADENYVIVCLLIMHTTNAGELLEFFWPEVYT